MQAARPSIEGRHAFPEASRHSAGQSRSTPEAARESTREYRPNSHLAAHQAELKVSVEAQSAFTAKITAYRAAQTARDEYERTGAPLYQALRDATEAIETEWRTLNGEISSQRTFSAMQRAGLGLPSLGSSGAPGGAPASKPLVRQNRSRPAPRSHRPLGG